MAKTERKQVMLVGQLTSANVSQVSAPTVAIPGTTPPATMHGKIADLTISGTGFYT